MRMFRLTRMAVALLGVLSAAATVQAEDWPVKPIKLVVPFPPGGGTDIISRVLAGKLAVSLKQAIVIENKPGAGGNIGVDQTAKAVADGYTIVMGQTSNLAINPALYEKLPYDPLKDLVPVALVADAPIVLVVAAGSRFNSLAEIMAEARTRPGELTLGSPGNGTVAHLTAELLQVTAGVKLQHIPYKGSSAAITDLLGGRIDLFTASVPSAFAQVKGGKMRAIAVSSAKRSSVLPETPAIGESGYAGFDATSWYGILLPAQTPGAIVRMLNEHINAALKDPEVREKLSSEGGAPIGGTPDEFTHLLRTDLERWGKIVRLSGAKVD